MWAFYLFIYFYSVHISCYKCHATRVGKCANCDGPSYGVCERQTLTFNGGGWPFWHPPQSSIQESPQSPSTCSGTDTWKEYTHTHGTLAAQTGVCMHKQIEHTIVHWRKYTHAQTTKPPPSIMQSHSLINYAWAWRGVWAWKTKALCKACMEF